MTKRDLSDIALKVLGIYMLTLSIDSFTGVIQSTTYFLHPGGEEANEDLIFLIANGFRASLYFIGFWLLSLQTARITPRLIKHNEHSEIVSIGKTDMLQVLFCVAGIVITFFAVSELWTQLTMASLWNADGFPEDQRQLYFSLMLGVPCTKGVMGVVFIFWSGGLARLLARNGTKDRHQRDE